jgi:hypothetical protein
VMYTKGNSGFGEGYRIFCSFFAGTRYRERLRLLRIPDDAMNGSASIIYHRISRSAGLTPD